MNPTRKTAFALMISVSAVTLATGVANSQTGSGTAPGNTYTDRILEPQNCVCGPVNDCNGIPLTATAHCKDYEACACVPVFGENNCIAALDAVCYTPALN